MNLESVRVRFPWLYIAAVVLDWELMKLMLLMQTLTFEILRMFDLNFASNVAPFFDVIVIDLLISISFPSL